MKPPIAQTIPHDVSIHGENRVDDYYWLRERDDPKVSAYLSAENDYTKELLKHTETLQESLYWELRARVRETDQSVPHRVGRYYYYSRVEEGRQYSIYCRKEGSLDAKEEVLLDENKLAQGHDYFAVGALEISPNHKLLAYSIDTNGS